MRSEFEKKLKCKELLSELNFCEETNSYVGDILPTNVATINGAYWAWEKRQVEVDELKKRVDAAFRVLSQINALDDEAHKRWKREACMFSQGESNAYEHAARLLEQALKGESNESST